MDKKNSKPAATGRIKRGRRVGLKDVAKACSLSAMTVSRALKDVKGVNPKTREKVIKKAREMGYVANTLAASLVQRSTHTVGVVVPDIDISFFTKVFKGLENALGTEGYRLFLCCSYDDPTKEFQEVQALLERRVDGIVIAPASVTDSAETAHRILANDCPMVFIDRTLPEMAVDSVIFDDYEGAYQAVTHLIGQGYRNIAHLAGPQTVWIARERLRGYKQAMADAGLKVGKSSIIHGALTVAGGEASMERLLALPKNPDAVFCVNDNIAVGAYKVLKRRGIRVPDAMGLVGFSDSFDPEILEMPLTSVVQDVESIGKQAAELLLARMSGDNASEEPVRRVIKTHLAVRRSSSPQ